MSKFNEDSRVKIPAILHLTKLGYQYLPLKNVVWDTDTNIFTNIFKESILRINQGMLEDDAQRLYNEVSLSLENEDLGQAFYEKLVSKSGIKLIDFENFDNNAFHVVTELTYKNGDEEFRPDIILLINGMPLVFIEVKKPNNRDGIIAERDRINRRFQNKKFRKFVNITQLMIFSNNMEYDPTDIEPLQGAYYASASYHKPVFNYFREEEALNLAALLAPLHEDTENFILKDNNLPSIKHSPEFLTNKSPETPTNRICTSLLSKERLAFVLRYAIAYVNESKGLEKHIMRYPQVFATKAIQKAIEADTRKGIIWHTQGSGKTALAYYNVKHLTDYFQQKQIIPKFYFIIDRLDLLTQAKQEFTNRGLSVRIVESREDFIKDLKTTTAIHNDSGKAEITVVNIQKFSDDSNVTSKLDYDVNIQRIYFLDEVHRSYNPKGSFLANLNESDANAIKIGLTGTPLIGEALSSKQLFGDYIHKYYYNASIADGYTLRLIREEIETEYKLTLQEALKAIKILEKELDKEDIFAHRKYVEPMLDYIVQDFENSRERFQDESIGGMVVCDSSKQAKMLYELFQEKYAASKVITLSTEGVKSIAADDGDEQYTTTTKAKYKVRTAAIILYDVGTKQEKKDWVDDFKDAKIDLLFVYNMLLTGFDAKRLKKLYLGRVIKKHNLLQTLTRVNRTYKNFRYGYVVDFADIQKEFKATNEAYFNELQEVLGDEFEHYNKLFKSQEEIDAEIEEIKDLLWKFDTLNSEIFSQQISEISDREEMLKIKKALENAKSLYNIIRLQGQYELLEKLDFSKINQLYREAANHLDLLNTKNALENNLENTNLLTIALENIIFKFTKVREEELKLADELKNTLQKTREALGSNFDKKDPAFISLYEELQRIFQKQNLNEVSQEEMKANIGILEKVYDKIKELNRKNNLLKAKFDGDEKFARIFKRLREYSGLSAKERVIYEALQDVKNEADERVLKNRGIMDNDSYFERLMMQILIEQFKNKNKIPLDAASTKYINNLIVREYLGEFGGVS